jgi:hypothetical protein
MMLLVRTLAAIIMQVSTREECLSAGFLLNLRHRCCEAFVPRTGGSNDNEIEPEAIHIMELSVL